MAKFEEHQYIAILVDASQLKQISVNSLGNVTQIPRGEPINLILWQNSENVKSFQC